VSIPTSLRVCYWPRSACCLPFFTRSPRSLFPAFLSWSLEAVGDGCFSTPAFFMAFASFMNAAMVIQKQQVFTHSLSSWFNNPLDFFPSEFELFLSFKFPCTILCNVFLINGISVMFLLVHKSIIIWYFLKRQLKNPCLSFMQTASLKNLLTWLSVYITRFRDCVDKCKNLTSYHRTKSGQADYWLNLPSEVRLPLAE